MLPFREKLGKDIAELEAIDKTLPRRGLAPQSTVPLFGQSELNLLKRIFKTLWLVNTLLLEFGIEFSSLYPGQGSTA